MKRILFLLMLLASTCLYSSSYRVFIKSNGNYDLKGKKFYIAIKDSSEINKDESVLQASYEDYVECAMFISRALELQGAVKANSQESSDFIVEYSFDAKMKDEWPISGGSYTAKSPYTGGVLTISRNKNMDPVAPVTFQNGRVVSQVFTYDHRQVTVSSADLNIKAKDLNGSTLWSSAISLKSDALFSDMVPVMMFSSLGRLGTRVNNQDFAVSDDEPAFKVYCNLGSGDDQLYVNPECSASKNENLRFIIKSSGKTFVGITNLKKLFKFYRIEDHRAIFVSGGKQHSSVNGFTFAKAWGKNTLYFEFNDDIDLSGSPDLIFRKNDKEILSFKNINC